MTSVLLLGAQGLVGRHLRAALDPGFIATTRNGSEGTIALDVRDADALRTILTDYRPRIVINAAAAAWVEQCEREPHLTRAVNVAPVGILGAYAERERATVVVFSSEYVFDGEKGPYREDDKTSPLNEYGRQKVDVERLAAATPRHLIVRTSAVYGEEPARKNFVWQLVDTVRTGRPFRVPSDQWVTPTFAPALAGAVVKLIEREATGIVHVCGPKVLRRYAFARMVAEAFALPPSRLIAVPTAELGLAARRPRQAGLRDTKMRRLLGHATPPPAVGLRILARDVRL